MKKTVKQWLLPLTLAAAAVAGWAFFGPPPPYTPVLTAQQTSNLHEYAYTVTSLPQASGIRILLHHGDGTFFMGNPSQLSSHSHIYPPGGSYSAFAEVVPLYDDDDNPKRTALQTITTGSSTSSFSATPINLNGKKVLLERDADAVPGDSITYIVTCENTGRCQTQTATATLAFTFDANVFDYVQTDGYPALTPNPPSTSGGATTVTTPGFTLGPGEQKSFFFLLETKTGLTQNTALAVDPSVVFHISSNACEDTQSDVITGQLVKNAHDPNYKAALAPNNMCGNSVSWRVHFQNEGNAAAKLIIIKDWIDTLLDYSSVTVVSNNLGLSNIPVTRLTAERAYKFVLHPIHLQGTHQIPKPREDETKGYIELTANKRVSQPCNAVVNRAQIRFGNNPPIETNAEFTPFPCSGICDTCTELLNLTLPIQQGLPDSSFLLPPSVTSSTWYNRLNNPNVYKKWYPTDGLDNPFALNPRILQQVKREYVLVASSSSPGSCIRWIVKVPVRPNCALGLAVQQTQNGGSLSACAKNVTANAAGQSPQYLLWNTGEKGVSSPQMRPNLAPQILYVAVWDTVTGCAQERWVKITDCNTRPPNNWWWLLWVGGLLAVIGGLLIAIFKNRTRNTFP